MASLLVVSLLISWLVRSRSESERARRHLARLVESSHEAIFGASREGVIESWNRGAEALFGYRAADAIGQPLSMLVPAERRQELAELMGRVMGGERVEEQETVRLHEDGHEVYVALNLSPIWGAGDAVIGGSAVARDITERHYLTERRERLLGRSEALARTDPLTGLANRRAWDEELRQELSRAGRHGWPLWVALLDLDHFKAFNDRHGHLAGDQLLSEAAAMWRVILRSGDLIARYGGEEFGVLLPNCSQGDAVEVVERLRAALPIGESCSGGLALWDQREAAGTLLSRADAALYGAKRDGRDRLLVAS